MLTQLHINNYALIEEVRLDFTTGFTVITGETGAGKSILLGALGLILGKRADLSSVGDPELKCVIEAYFDLNKLQLQPLFEEQDLDYDVQTIIRREILPSGKSRAFINDTPATLNALSALGEKLIDIHSQHQTLEVVDNSFQFQVVDAFAGTHAVVLAYGEKFSAYQKLLRNIKQLEAKKAEALTEEAYNNHLLSELLEAKLKPGEQEELEATYDTLSNVGQITETLAEALNLIVQEDVGISPNLIAVKQGLGKISGFSKALEDMDNRVASVSIELADIAETLEEILENTESDPETLLKAETRLKLLFDLQKKHNAGTVEELIEIRDALDAEVQDLNDLDSTIEKLKREASAAKESLEKLAEDISRKRKKALQPLAEKLEDILSKVGMPNARFDLKLETAKELRDNGKDNLQFLFSANKGMRAQEMAKAASGGELSRIMLAIKAILSGYAQLPTLIFDEIDTGVSGEVALKMGTIMKEMGKHMQLVSITHLPQIAGQGSTHLKVYKNDQKDKTITQISQLDQEQRILELAEMLGGKTITSTSREQARELLAE
ncbi:MAG: DNA repair protein RecN [Leeuwenhoekiella sp.]